MKLKRARSLVLSRFPYLATVMLRLPIVVVDNFPTAFVTDKGVIGIGRKFMDEITSGELAGILVHEGFHWMWIHFKRRGARDPKLYNIAADLVINETIRRMCSSLGGTITLPKGVLYPEQYQFDWKDKIPSVDEVYELLKQSGADTSKFQPCGSGAGCPVDEEGQAPGEAVGGVEEAQDVASMAADAIAKGLKQAGAGSGELDLWADAAAKRPKVDPLKALRSRVGRDLASASGRHVEPTWNKANRRGFEYLPGRKRFAPEVTIVVDTSGSMMNKHDGDHVLSQVYGVLSQLGAVRLVLCDTRVTFDGKVRNVSGFRKACKGGGGTDLTAALEVCEGTQALIVLTDGCLDRPRTPVSDRALWAVTRASYVQPWMKRVIVLEA